MATGLFKMLQSVQSTDEMLGFLDSSTFDVLVEFDLNSRTFQKIHDVSKKYPIPLQDGSFEDMYVTLVEILIHPEDKMRFCVLMTELEKRLNESEIPGLVSEEFRIRLLSGSYIWEEILIISGERFGLGDKVYRMFFYDVHVRKARELGLSDEPVLPADTRNELTGLPNKRQFTKGANKLLKNQLERWCVIAVDIENFKLFNEWYGHNRGDLLMTQIGMRLRIICEDMGGVAGYFGQDDFCLMIPYIPERIDKLYSDIAALVSEHGSAMSFMPAFGVSIAEEDVKLRDLLDRAFLAVRNAKESYHSRIRIYDKAMYTKTDKEYHILSDFFKAIKENEFVFYLQPQCRSSNGKIVGAEALARWKKRDGTLVPPDSFIPVLEKHGLITDLDMYIWEEVCKWIGKCIENGLTPVPISVNVSVIDILHSDITSIFDGLTRKYDISRDLINIEITESAYMSNTEYINSVVQGLRQKGFLVMMDDFGSGYSSLNMLKSLSLDIVKLDAQFLRTENSDKTKSMHILESVASMTKTLELPIVVEGVESREQKDYLQNIGCSYMQGYYFYKPMPVADFEKLLSDTDHIDSSGIRLKTNKQFRLQELLGEAIYSDNMLNNILGPCAFYLLHDNGQVDIVRFNEQFYEAVDVPDFHDRLTDIKRFLPKSDYAPMLRLLHEAEKDLLNGSTGLLHFYKTDGTLTTFFMRFYYLRDEGDDKLFYGAVQNITKLALLERKMSMLMEFSRDTVVFLRRKPDRNVESTVMFNGLEKQFGISRQALEKELNRLFGSGQKKIDPDCPVKPELFDRLAKAPSFEDRFNLTDIDGKTYTILIYVDCITDETGNIDCLVTLRNTSNAQ